MLMNFFFNDGLCYPEILSRVRGDVFKKKKKNNMYIQVLPFSVESFFMAEFISPPLQI